LAINLFITKLNQITPLFNDKLPKNVNNKQFNHHQIKFENQQLNYLKLNKFIGFVAKA